MKNGTLKRKVLNLISEGRELSSLEISRLCNCGDPNATIRDLIKEGYAIHKTEHHRAGGTRYRKFSHTPQLVEGSLFEAEEENAQRPQDNNIKSNQNG